MAHEEDKRLLDLVSRATLMDRVDEIEFSTYEEEKDACRRCGRQTFLHDPKTYREICVNCGCEHGY